MIMIEKVAIIGMGALGLLYADRISKGGCNPVFVMDEDHLKRTDGNIFTVNGQPVCFDRISVADAEPADFVIVATKTTALDSAIAVMRNCVNENTVIICVCNGITSEEIIGAKYGIKRVIPCVAQGMDAVKFGTALNFSKEGVLIVGKLPETDPEAFDKLTAFFDRVGVSYISDENIMLRMWKKFMLNCGINQSCMLYGATYGEAVVRGSRVFETFTGAMHEVMMLARAEGYLITQDDIDYYIELMESLDPKGMPSMAQDRINRRPSEVDTFSGTVIRLARRHGLSVPVNLWIYDEVQRIEEGYRQE